MLVRVPVTAGLDAVLDPHGLASSQDKAVAAARSAVAVS